MASVSATEISLSTISSERLWQDSGRLESATELFRFKDRKGGRYLLAPTHEEEVTKLVAGIVFSKRQLPMRVFQIGRKYRDELRPRGGMLRGREFTMKDLYTFDVDEVAAMETYKEVQKAYRALFTELGVPFLVAEADSGTMGGSMSHEYLFASAQGEDEVISCGSCNYTANVETVTPRLQTTSELPIPKEEIAVHHSITQDRLTLVNSYYRQKPGEKGGEVNLQTIRQLVPDVDTGVGGSVELWREHFRPYETDMEPGTYSQVINLFDAGLPRSVADAGFAPHTDHVVGSETPVTDKHTPTTTVTAHPDGRVLQLVKIRDGDACPRCDAGKLEVQKGIEIGHTFHLGTRYTEPLNCKVSTDAGTVPIQQGCHGIGVSRMIPAVADAMRGEGQLRWPRVVAPFEVCVFGHPELAEDAESVYDVLAGRGLEGGEGLDVVLDDRVKKSLAWKMKDAGLIGVPVVCVLGKGWKSERKVEVRCERKGYEGLHELSEVKGVVDELLKDL